MTTVTQLSLDLLCAGAHNKDMTKTATPKQQAFYAGVLADCVRMDENLRPAAEAAVAAIATLTVEEASAKIGKALATRTALYATAPKPPAPLAKRVTDGDYALQDGDTLKFYTVSTGKKGQWTGFQFVTVHASDERFPVKGETRKAVLAAIAADPAEASGRYGRHFQQCGRCHKQLTDEVSRQRGIGPDCFKKYFDGASFE